VLPANPAQFRSIRFVARLLEGEKMASLCRQFSISRKTGYKIFDRYKESGLEALTNRARYFVQGTVLESSRTENPAESAALANRWSPQMKLLLEGRCSHQIKDAASCKLSAARKECLSNNCVAKSRT
jgi:hypothetical protein